jgi:NADP-dependent 3-hydroxy acid dehydrogenase YdfG
MNRIFLAYAAENKNLADEIEHSLSRIGVPFDHPSAPLAAQIAAAAEPTLLLVTDNFLKSSTCLEGLLPVLQSFSGTQRLAIVLANGIREQGQPVETHIDRMANVLHYMNHWQNVWLSLSDQYQQASGEEKTQLNTELEKARGIANQIGDLIGFFRDKGYMTWEAFSYNHYEAFFQQFNLSDWHGQYKRAAEQALVAQAAPESSYLPEIPLSGGKLSPVVLEETPTLPIEEEIVEEPLPFAEDELTETLSPPEAPASELEAVIRDAWVWIEKGYPERGVELFQIAAAENPDNPWLQQEYQKALELTGNAVAKQMENSPPPPVEPVVPKTSPGIDNEAKSYELMGDMAVDRGDYLFAKYCWDRVVEIDPAYPGIYRKLGLMVSEHLHDYRETALAYLRMALETNPNDPEVALAVQSMQPTETKPPVQAPIPLTVQEHLPIAEPEAVATAEASVPAPSRPLALITGATSGIGRATAELFAQNGYRLILTGRRLERLVALKKQLESQYGSDVLALPFDVRDAGAVEAALGNLPENYQKIDVLINNAGLAKGLSPIHEGSLEHWETMIDTNVKGLLYVTRIVSQGMVKRKSGHIINVSSSAGKEAYPNGNVYCATKFAVEALTKSMRFDLHTHNIRVSQVSPGHVEETEFALNRFDGDAERAKIYQDFQPLKARDVAEVIYFMAARPPHVNIQDIHLFATQQASSMVIDRSGR